MTSLDIRQHLMMAVILHQYMTFYITRYKTSGQNCHTTLGLLFGYHLCLGPKLLLLGAKAPLKIAQVS